jgi:Sulfotransferase family
MSRPGGTRTLPTFFVIGAAKAGTTSLNRYLGLHPEIHVSPIKEPNFFSGPADRFPYQTRRIDDADEYERLFVTDKPVRGEASPSYTQYPRRTGVPARIKAAVPDVRFVYMVRDPIERTISHYLHWVAFEGEKRSLKDALADAEDPTNLFTCASRYATQLEQYLVHFPRSRILVVDQSSLLTERATTLSTVFGFLGVDPTFSSGEFERELNLREGRNIYAPGYARFRKRKTTGVLHRLPKGVRRGLRRTVEHAESLVLPKIEEPSLDQDLRARLEEVYRPEVERLRSLTGQAFPSWSI